MRDGGARLIGHIGTATRVVAALLAIAVAVHRGALDRPDRQRTVSGAVDPPRRRQLGSGSRKHCRSPADRTVRAGRRRRPPTHAQPRAVSSSERAPISSRGSACACSSASIASALCADVSVCQASALA
jgi:hypothetical protein